MIGPAIVERTLGGLWAVHGSVSTVGGDQRFSRWPKCHLAFEGRAWRLHWTRWKQRLPRAGVTSGSWRVVELDDRPLIVFTVRSYRPSAAYNAMLQANYGYSGGAMAVAAVKTARGADARKMLDGEVLMYYLPVRLEPTELIVALPSNGADAPRQRWVRR